MVCSYGVTGGELVTVALFKPAVTTYYHILIKRMQIGPKCSRIVARVSVIFDLLTIVK